MDVRTYLSGDGPKGFEKSPFIKAADVGAKGAKAKVLGAREAPKAMKYSDILLDVQVNGKKRTIGLRADSIDLANLAEALGNKTEKWAGKTIGLVVKSYTAKKGKNKGKQQKAVNIVAA